MVVLYSLILPSLKMTQGNVLPQKFAVNLETDETFSGKCFLYNFANQNSYHSKSRPVRGSSGLPCFWVQENLKSFNCLFIHIDCQILNISYCLLKPLLLPRKVFVNPVTLVNLVTILPFVNIVA